MTEHEFDWHAYVLNEMPAAERERAAAHLAAHPEARAEVDDLELTLSALGRLPQAEPVRRIAFVSDPVLEPNWWQRFWASGPRLAFAGAAMLSLAIVVHALVPRGPAPAVATGGITVEQVRTEVAAAVQAARAVEQVRFEQVKAEILEEAQAQRRADLELVRESFLMMEKRLAAAQSLAVRYGGD
ncbi:MAG: hypothetical protein M9913_17570 [Bryobacteraceae bacterium]|nr:hypothetical protein [Solibacteraceae bacterium]MCL4843349.1 hypothetical protein [Bryobacteraceae bacterium]MCO5352676.1 hypothetical protein [Bryobacteraceae bacterium]